MTNSITRDACMVQLEIFRRDVAAELQNAFTSTEKQLPHYCSAVLDLAKMEKRYIRKLNVSGYIKKFPGYNRSALLKAASKVLELQAFDLGLTMYLEMKGASGFTYLFEKMPPELAREDFANCAREWGVLRVGTLINDVIRHSRMDVPNHKKIHVLVNNDAERRDRAAQAHKTSGLSL